MTPLTNRDKVDAYRRRMGLTFEQTLLVIARAALVRELAKHEHFVLKGGTLLQHVYNGPRSSIRDIDLAHTDHSVKLLAPDLDKIFTIVGPGFRFTSEEGTWHFTDDMFEAPKLPFTIQLDRDAESGKLALSISIREEEQLDTSGSPQYFHCEALLGSNHFRINCLTLDELAAEKLLGWCSKRFARHYFDLAVLARDFGSQLAAAKIVDLTARKFRNESGHAGYIQHAIKRPIDLARALVRP